MTSPTTSFLSDRSGNFAMVMSVSTVVLLAIAGFAVNTISVDHEQAALQDALDGAVLAGASLGYSASDRQRIAEAEKFMQTEGYRFGKVASRDIDVKDVAAMFSISEKQVVGSATIVVPNFFAGFAGSKNYSVSAEAKATKRSSDPVCFLALNPELDGAIQLYGNATMEADCAVMANSDHMAGILTWGAKSWAKAKAFGVTGSFKGAFLPVPIDDVEPMDDPYAGIPVPPAGACVEIAAKLMKATVTLDPGTYCGGLTISPHSTVTLNPGTYVFKDGPLQISAESVLTGENVTLAFVGKDAIFLTNANAEVHLTSPVKGTYANIQFISDRTAKDSKMGEEWTTISSTKIGFDGVMYLPEQDIWLKGDTVFNGKSPTMIVAVDQFWVQDGARVTISQRNDRGIAITGPDDGFHYAARLAE